jgi:predicted nucleotidyltransferase
MNKVPPILKGLFVSKIRVKILEHFLTHSNDSFYSRQLEKILAEPVGPIGRELLNLEKLGILTFRNIGNQKHYQVNKEMIFFEDLRLIFLKATIGEVLKKQLSIMEGVELAFIYGSFAKGEEYKASDIDIMVVGNLADKAINQAISRSEKELRRTINYSLYDLEEVKERLKNRDNFIKTVFSEPHIILIGNRNDELFRTG